MATAILQTQRICAIPIPDHKDACWVNVEVAANRIDDAKVLSGLMFEILCDFDPTDKAQAKIVQAQLHVLNDQMRRELKKSHKMLKAVTTRLIELRA